MRSPCGSHICIFTRARSRMSHRANEKTPKNPRRRDDDCGAGVTRIHGLTCHSYTQCPLQSHPNEACRRFMRAATSPSPTSSSAAASRAASAASSAPSLRNWRRFAHLGNARAWKPSLSRRCAVRKRPSRTRGVQRLRRRAGGRVGKIIVQRLRQRVGTQNCGFKARGSARAPVPYRSRRRS